MGRGQPDGARRPRRGADRAATWLPWVVLALFAAAALVAPDRRRGLLVVLGFLVAAGAWLAGPGRVPVALRRVVTGIRARLPKRGAPAPA